MGKRGPKPKTLEERFWSKVGERDPMTGCMNWEGAVTSSGYGNFWLEGQQYKSAHVVAWELQTGQEVPKGMDVCHHCDNRICVNFVHLFLGTRKDNLEDMMSKGRQSKGEKHPRSKLTKTKVLEIDSRIKRGECQSKLAAEFQVSASRISHIRHRRDWKEVLGVRG